MITIKTLEGCEMQQLCDVFNLAFSDYFIAFNFSVDQLATKFRTENTSLIHSVGAFDGEKLVGFIFHGFRIIDSKKILYNGGTGVVPSHRGQALTQKMYEFYLPKAKENGISEIWLEVMTQNTQAIISYERTGFVNCRTVRCYSGSTHLQSPRIGLEITLAENLDYSSLKKFWNITPTWQNNFESLANIPEMISTYIATLNGAVVGYLTCNKLTNRVYQLAVDPALRRQSIGKSLVIAMAQATSQPISIINVDHNYAPIHDFLQKAGLTENSSQYEMKLSM